MVIRSRSRPQAGTSGPKSITFTRTFPAEPTPGQPELAGEWRPVIQACPVDGGPLVKYQFFASEHREVDPRMGVLWGNPPAHGPVSGRTVSDYFSSRRQQIRHAIAKASNPSLCGGEFDRPARLRHDGPGGIYVSRQSAREAGSWLFRAGRTTLAPEPGRDEPHPTLLDLAGEEYLRGLAGPFHDLADGLDHADIGLGTTRRTLAKLVGDAGAPIITFWNESGWPEAPVEEWRRALTFVFSQLDGISIR